MSGAAALPMSPSGCGSKGCYACWGGDHLSKSAYEALRRVETMLTEAIERTPIDWSKIRKVSFGERWT